MCEIPPGSFFDCSSIYLIAGENLRQIALRVTGAQIAFIMANSKESSRPTDFLKRQEALSRKEQ
jgi:hypothetical protein